MNLWAIRRILLESNTGNNGGGSPPAPASSPAAPAAPSSASAGDDFDFGALATHVDAGDEGADTSVFDPDVPSTSPAPPSGSPAAPAAPAAVQPPPPAVAAPSAVVAPVVPPAAAPVAPPAPTLAAAPQPAAPPATPEQGTPPSPGEQTFEQHRAQFLPQLEQLYQLTPEQVEQIRTNPEQVLPKLAAQLHYEVQLAAHNSIASILPQMIQLHQQQTAAHTEYENRFYGQFPALKSAVAADKAKEQTIIQSIRAFKHANPKASEEEVRNGAGLLAMMALKLPLEGLLGGGGTQQVAAPTAPAAAPSAAPPMRQVPPRPAGVGATAHIPTPAPGGGEEENIFTALANATLSGEVD